MPKTPFSLKKPIVIGIFGLPGCGKSFLLNQLRNELPSDQFSFFDGSEVIDSVVRGGLRAFQRMDQWGQRDACQKAIRHISHQCTQSGRVGVVAHHSTCLPEDEPLKNDHPGVCWTDSDASTYSHVVYLEVDPSLIVRRRAKAAHRVRTPASLEDLDSLQGYEQNFLRRFCYNDRILFTPIVCWPNQPPLLLPMELESILWDSQQHSANQDWGRIRTRLDSIMKASDPQLETILVFDGDKTLVAHDTGSLFWEVFRKNPDDDNASSNRTTWHCPLKKLFLSDMGHSYEAFRQESFLFGQVEKGMFDAVCEEVARSVSIYAELHDLILKATAHPHVGVIVVTNSQHQFWDRVVARAGLSGRVRVIGAGRAPDPNALVITSAYKAGIVRYLRTIHNLHVIAFGDCPLDILMLKYANEAIVVVGTEDTRSRTMDAKLGPAITRDGLPARQILLPSGVSNRLNIEIPPIIGADDAEILRSVVIKRRNAPAAGAP